MCTEEIWDKREPKFIAKISFFFALQVILGLTSLMKISGLNLLNFHVKLMNLRISVAPHGKVSCLTTVASPVNQKEDFKAI